jgi:cysteine synthase A
MTDPAALQAIGNTPFVRLARIEQPGAGEVWAKWEGANPTGSMKDRMALGMVEHGERTGALRPGMKVLEYTGGSTGSSLAMVCAAKGYRAHLVSADCFATEKLRTMRAFGAELEILESEGGMVTPTIFRRMEARVRELLAEGDGYWTGQFVNPGNAAGYEALGNEILAHGPVDGFVTGVGTGGCFSGVATVLKERSDATLCLMMEPAGSPFLSTGKGGPHRLEGIGTGFHPPGLRADLADGIETVTDGDAYAMARRLAAEEGMFVGITSGANVVAALRLAARLGPGRRVVTVLVDSGLKYLAGDLYA